MVCKRIQKHNEMRIWREKSSRGITDSGDETVDMCATIIEVGDHFRW